MKGIDSNEGVWYSKYMGKKIKRVAVSPELVSDMVRYGKAQTTVVDGLPDTAVLKGASYDNMSQSFNLFYEDDSFKEIPEGTIPDLLLVSHRRDDE